MPSEGRSELVETDTTHVRSKGAVSAVSLIMFNAGTGLL